MNNILIGNQATASSVSVCNEITIGTTAYTAQRAPSATWAALSDQRDKTNVDIIPIGLAFIRELRPVKFTWQLRGTDNTHPRWNMSDSGFIAQELLEIAQKYNVQEFLKLADDRNPDEIYADPGRLLPVLVKSIQELADTNDSLLSRIEALEKQLNYKK
jgi:hypothetical protein